MKTNKRQDLTEREYSFCYHYINTGNARDAAILAGYTTEPERKGMKLLANKNIKSKIDELYSEKKKNLCFGFQEYSAFCCQSHLCVSLCFII